MERTLFFSFKLENLKSRIPSQEKRASNLLIAISFKNGLIMPPNLFSDNHYSPPPHIRLKPTLKLYISLQFLYNLIYVYTLIPNYNSYLHWNPFSGVLSSVTFKLVNKCNYTVWPGIVSDTSIALLSTTGFALQKNEFRTIAQLSTAPLTPPETSTASLAIAAPGKSNAQDLILAPSVALIITTSALRMGTTFLCWLHLSVGLDSTVQTRDAFWTWMRLVRQSWRWWVLAEKRWRARARTMHLVMNSTVAVARTIHPARASHQTTGSWFKKACHALAVTSLMIGPASSVVPLRIT